MAGGQIPSLTMMSVFLNESTRLAETLTVVRRDAVATRTEAERRAVPVRVEACILRLVRFD